MELKIIEKYISWVEFDQMKYSALTWVLITIAISAIIGGASFVLSSLILNEFTLLPAAIILATLVLMLGYPYLLKESIINSVERNFGDALKQMADTLKAGDTYESALREVVESDYGRLSDEMQLAIRRIEDGENLETSLTSFADRIDSRLVKRTIVIILDSIKTGASLADILDEIADDVKDFQRLKEERKSGTTMQFYFMVAAGGFIAPAIFGEINSVIGSFANISSQTLNPAQLLETKSMSNFTLMLIQLYIIIEVVGTGTMMSLVREGKVNKSIIYIPVLLLVAFVAYYLSTFVIKGMMSGV
ncbi:MAG: type II secretion system F family protein [archaeon]|jgi:flagellar protein FlaJ